MQSAQPSQSSKSRAHEAFLGTHGTVPQAISQAPARVNLIGEHTDYNEGYVLPMPIPLFCSVAVGEAAAAYHVLAVDLHEEAIFELTDVLEGDDHGTGIEPGSWQSYVFGVIHEVADWLHQRRLPALPPLNLTIASDVPMGAGLSSSAALEIAVARALGLPAFRNGSAAYPDPVELAKLCQQAEHEFARVPCGIMDQLIVSTGNPGATATMIDCRTLMLRPVPLPDPRIARVAVIDTRARHSNAAGEYASRRHSCEEAAKELGVSSLRDADAYMLEHARQALTPEQFNCALHVVSENPRVLMAAEALRAGDMERLGDLMNLSHHSLRDLYRVSSPELDAVVEGALSVKGVFGARMTGAGLGGCAIALCMPNSISDLEQAVRKKMLATFGREPGFIVV